MRSNASRFISHSDSATLYHSQQALGLLKLQHPLFDAVISPQGAQLLSFKPTGDNDWLWLDHQQAFKANDEIIGGIPLCLPWFGRLHEPIHGFARFEHWQLSEVIESDDAVELRFSFKHEGNNKRHNYPHRFSAEHRIRLSNDIQLTLNTTNDSAKPLPLSFAWHSYFACNNLQQCRISGLENLMYFDNTRGFSQQLQRGDVKIQQTTDQVYLNTQGQQLHGLHQQPLNIHASNAPSCIIWNPFNATEQLSSDAYKNFICVERGRAFDDTIALLPQQALTSQLTITKA